MPGPKPLPTQRKRNRGTDRPDRVAPNEPMPEVPPEVPSPPAWLSDVATDFWNVYAPRVHKAGLLTEIDVPAFEAMCSHYGLMVSAATALRDGVLREGYRGDETKHPATQVFRDNSTAFRAYAAMFGMSPADRTRVSSAIAKDDGPKGILSLAA